MNRKISGHDKLDWFVTKKFILNNFICMVYGCQLRNLITEKANEKRFPMAVSGFSESIENYLEVILDLENTNKVARAKDIANRLSVNRGSVTGALKNLSEKGLINYEPYNFITLTSEGKRIAGEITRRHGILKNFLLNVLCIDPETAEETACRMEHVIDRKTADRFLQFVEYIDKCPERCRDWIQSFSAYCLANEGENPNNSK